MSDGKETTKMTTITAILGGEKELGQKVKKPVDFDALIKKGMPSGVVSHIKEVFKLPDEVIARIIGVSPRTVARRRKPVSKPLKASGGLAVERLSPVESDRIYRFARIVARATDTFENKEDALEWLNSNQPGLGGAVPFDMLQTDAGTREVEELLVRIDYGVIS